MKKLIALLLALVMVFALAACGSATTEEPKAPEAANTPAESPAETPAEAPKEEVKIKIGLTLSSLTTNSVFIDMSNRLQEQCDANGWELILRDLTADTIVNTMENFVSAGCNVVIIQANQAPEAVAAMMPTFEENDVAVAIYDHDGFVDYPAVAYSATCDNYNAGYQLGKAAAEWANENIEGHVYAGVINRESNEVFRPRAEGIIAALEEHLKDGGVYGSVESQPGTAEGGMVAAEDLMSAIPNMNLLVAWNGGSGVGAYEALKASNYEGYLFTCDNSQDEVKALMEGKFLIGSLDLDLGNQVLVLANKTVEYVQNGYQYPEGTTDEDKLWAYPMTLVTQEMAPDYWLGN